MWTEKLKVLWLRIFFYKEINKSDIFFQYNVKLCYRGSDKLSYEFSPFIVVFSLISLRQNKNGTYFSLLDVHWYFQLWRGWCCWCHTVRKKMCYFTWKCWYFRSLYVIQGWYWLENKITETIFQKDHFWDVLTVSYNFQIFFSQKKK
jgi:hypothetical protein